PSITPSYVKCGSYQSDLDSGQYQLSWTSPAELQAWIRAEEIDKTVELILKESEPNRGTTDHQWTKKHVYVCARMGTGGKSKYAPKCNQERKVDSKRMPCPCRLVAKTYPNTHMILGRYDSSHSHPVGSDNLKYTRIPSATLLQIEGDL
ncbi:hypothetical protein DFH07DRAFT_696269, partial [Mycena maculata]